MARFGVVGDLHGQIDPAIDVLTEMGERKISHAFVVGDFGLWGGLDGHRFLDVLQREAEQNNLSVMAIPGNHENYDIFEHYQASYPTHKGFTYLRSRVLMSPKANKFKLFGKQFVVAGGAVSIDKAWRLAQEKGLPFNTGWGFLSTGRATGDRTLWWPQEQLTDEEERQIISYGQADILLTHDASNATPWGQRLKNDLDSEMHRHRIDRILRAVRPQFHFHGHFHELYHWENRIDGDTWVETWGLDRDGSDDNWGIFDTDTMKFALRGEGMQFRSLDFE